MPLYEYQCRKCRHRFERIQQYSDHPVKKCPECGGAVEKLLSAPAAHFKGSGFYATDYPRTGAGASSNNEGSATKGESSSENVESSAKKVESGDGAGSKPESGDKSSKAKAAPPASKKAESKK